MKENRELQYRITYERVKEQLGTHSTDKLTKYELDVVCLHAEILANNPTFQNIVLAAHNVADELDS